MRKRISILLVLIGWCALFAASVQAQRLFFNTAPPVSVTSTNSAISFTDNGSGGSSVAFLARHVTVRSLATSANTCYFDLKDTVATTSDTALEPGGVWNIPFTESGTSGWAGMGAICDTAQTATFVVTATR
jgi:hypothetical protein